MTKTIGTSALIDVWADDGNIVVPDDTKIDEGWVLGEQPPHEYMNWLHNTFGKKINHMLKNGVPDWNSTTEWKAGSVVNHGGKAWLSRAANTNSVPVSGNTNWLEVGGSSQVASVAALKVVGPGLFDGQQALVRGFYADTPSIGGGVFSWDATCDKTLHNGVTIIDPDISATPGSEAWYTDTGTGSGCWIRAEQAVDIRDCGINPGLRSQSKFASLLGNGVDIKIPKLLASLSDLSAYWQAGEKYPIVFYGDSTTDGRVTTINGVDLATVWNIGRLVGGNVPYGLVYDHDDTEVPNAYPNILQRLARLFYGNSSLRCYNAGYRGMGLQDTWAGNNVHNAIYGNSVYEDAKMIFINFGLNDVADQSDDELLVSRVTRQTEALILDAYLRGVQPCLITCNSNEGGRIDVRPSVRVTGLVDKAKRMLASRYGIPLLDMNKMLREWMNNNGDVLTYPAITADGLHLNDLGHMKQAEFLLKEIAGDLILSVSDRHQVLDYTDPVVRLDISAEELASGTNINRGLGEPARNIRMTLANTISRKGANIIDLWVWCDYRDTSAIYMGIINEALVPNLVGTQDTPAFFVESQIGTALDYYQQTVKIRQPDLYGMAGPSRQMGCPVFLNRLAWGLNRIRFAIPAELATTYITNSWYIGHLEFVPDAPENMRPAIGNYVSIEGSSYMMFEHATPWRDCLTRSGPLTARTSEANSVVAVPYDRRVGNRAALRGAGDWVQWKVNASWAEGGAVLLGYNLADNNADATFSVAQKRHHVKIGERLILRQSLGDVDVFLSLANGNNALGHSVMLAGVVPANITGKDLHIYLERLSSGNVQILVHDDNYSQLFAVEIDPVTADPGRLVRMLSAGFIVGGVRIPPNPELVGAPFRLNSLQVRQSIPDLASITTRLVPV